MCTALSGVLIRMYQAKFNLVFDNLPPRQKEVLLKLLAGEVDEAIAKSLNIEKSTVRKHIEKIHKAFDLKNDFSDERRSTRLDLLLLFAKYKPDLLGESSLQSEERSQPAESPQLPQLDSSNATRDNNPDSARREETADSAPGDLDALVQRVRARCHGLIQEQCGTMRVLDMSQPIGLSHLYTSVNILEKISSRQWREIDELLEERNPANFYRFGLSRVTETRVPGLEAVKRYLKLMILGKPGSGKTTFLKYLAIQCNVGVFQADRVPIFITLKNLAEAEGQPSLLEYITQFFSDCDIGADQAALLLKRGRALILLDGLDEAKEEDDRRISKQVRDFSEKFCTNQFVITCRIAARKYIFDKFTEVEVADFDSRQITTFVQKWFQDKEPAKADGLTQQLRENRPILELATNPLLLTLLCLVFEESAKFPTNRSELYEEGIDILLKRWDEKREIERTQIYKNLSVQRKKDLLSKIALITFERGDYFFKQKELEQHISDYICNLPNAQNDQEALQVDSEAVLNSIEAQHGLLVERAKGIYSFSHLTFQEYFTAREMVKKSESENLEMLASHIIDSRWREVFLLASEMLPIADEFFQLIKQQVDTLVAQDSYLQEFLLWARKKSSAVSAPYKLSAVRALYFESALYLESDSASDEFIFGDCINIEEIFDLARILESGFDNGLDLSRPLFYSLELDISLIGTLYWAKRWFYPFQDTLDPYDSARKMAAEHNSDVESNLASALESISFQKCELHSSLENLKT